MQLPDHESDSKSWSLNSTKAWLEYLPNPWTELRENRSVQVGIFLAVALLGLNKVRGFWKEFQEHVPETGLAQLSRELLDKLGIEIEVKGNREVLNTPAGAGQLLLGVNHVNILEPVVAASLFQRIDLYLIGVITYGYFMNQYLRDHFIGIMPRKYAIDKQAKKKLRLADLIDLVKKAYIKQRIDSRAIAHMNKTALEQAAGLLTEGDEVILFPGGGMSTDKPWGHGVGNIMLQLAPEQRPHVQLLPVYFDIPSRKRMVVSLAVQHRLKRLSSWSETKGTVWVADPFTVEEVFTLAEQTKTPLTARNLTQLLQRLAYDKLKQKGAPLTEAGFTVEADPPSSARTD